VGRSEVNVLDIGLDRQAGELNAALQAAILAAGDFKINEDGQLVFEGQFGIAGVMKLFFQARPESGQAQDGVPFEQGLDRHGGSSWLSVIIAAAQVGVGKCHPAPWI